jgi:hypothetical protein
MRVILLLAFIWPQFCLGTEANKLAYESILKQLNINSPAIKLKWSEEKPQKKLNANQPSKLPKHPLSRGEKFVQEQKEKIRQQIAESRKTDNSTASKDNSLIDEHRETLKRWKAEHQATLNRWKKEKDRFYQNISLYAKYTEDLKRDEALVKQILKDNLRLLGSQNSKETKKPLKAKSQTGSKASIGLIEGALSIEVKNQYARATCSAFAVVRGLEILASQKLKRSVDLSEQYFYWASKPKCRQTPCSERGSWGGYGLEYSAEQPGPDIPLELDCPYQGSGQEGNETLLPLAAGCRKKGKVQVADFHYTQDLNLVRERLLLGQPVVASIRLSANFYRNNGLILFQDKDVGPDKLDYHSMGHAILLIGYLPLDKSNVSSEGQGCYMATNSWGIGWGKGGFACISERWLKYHKRRNPYIVLSQVHTN